MSIQQRGAIIGATGLVGQKLIDGLASRGHKPKELLLGASSRSAGQTRMFHNEELTVQTVDDVLAQKPKWAIFSAGSGVSKEWAPRFVEAGCRVIDNSSCWRMEDGVPLVVPEINLDSVNDSHGIIANPNCSTIQLVLALRNVQQKFGIKRMVLATYQSVSGTGKEAITQLMTERMGKQAENMAYPHPIDMKCLPVNGALDENNDTAEEVKLREESQKIFNDPAIAVTATVVRVPVQGGHSIAANVELRQAFSLDAVKEAISEVEGVIVQDKPEEHIYPMPRFVESKEEVFVGRIRKDVSMDNAFNCWIVADNLLKGAATNAIQIVEGLGY
ncbi:MAG: aspartate-semialdehyde dehydrogenase [Bacteroidota bacterium]|nr:aspartate-semialdehyde dehydrogenase [Bacteroidota bacterium]